MYKSLQQDSQHDEGASTQWYCRPSCNKVADKILIHLQATTKEIKELKQELEETKASLNQMREKMTKIQDGEFTTKMVDAIKNLAPRQENEDTAASRELEERVGKVEEKVNKTYASVAAMNTGETKNHPPNRTTIIQDSVKEVSNRENRKANLVWFGIPESGKDDPQERKLEDLKAMKALGETVFELENPETAFVNAVRLGQKGDRPRPLLTTMNCAQIASDILQGARALGKPEHKEKRISVKKDMTPLEREEHKKLMRQLHTKREETKTKGSGEIWVIRNEQIVDIARRKDSRAEDEKSKDQ